MQTNNKLREALKDIGRLVEQIHFLYSDYPSEIHEIARKVNAALAEPVKNCEVGTAGEQSERLHAYCKSHRCLYCSSGNGDECKFYRHGMKTDCKIEWANAPYEEGGAKIRPVWVKRQGYYYLEFYDIETETKGGHK